MEGYDLFPSTVWSVLLDLNLDELRKVVYNFSKTHPSETYTNIGGYQGHYFDYKLLNDAIRDNIPRYKDPELGDLHINSWVNINGKGCYNKKHTHADGVVLLSGAYYVTVPENSGNILFSDPRPTVVHSFADSRYYNSYQIYPIQPKENMLLLFPCWLEHQVEPNNSNEDRISISFNLMREKDIEQYENLRSTPIIK
tara:strand:+ start:277 stop:867 length:591 start_codon:yes stop_codon:yes gene_type:complete